LDYLVGGWRITSVSRFHAGAPFHILSWYCNVPGQFRLGCLAGQIQGANPWAQDKGNFDPAEQMLNPSAFESYTAFDELTYYGVGPRVTNLRADGYQNQDLTLAKTFPITERVHFQIRGDFFNLFNQHTFRTDDFDYDVSSPSFGYWNGGVTGPRSIQIGGRIQF
jgi:hypothetical protein